MNETGRALGVPEGNIRMYFSRNTQKPFLLLRRPVNIYCKRKNSLLTPRKKELASKNVKEQRVDGSFFINHKLMKLRCTLMGFERNYQISNPSKQIFINNFKLLTQKFKPCLNRSFYTQTNNLITYSNFNKQISTARPSFIFFL
jgi:hypothetical protein